MFTYLATKSTTAFLTVMGVGLERTCDTKRECHFGVGLNRGAPSFRLFEISGRMDYLLKSCCLLNMGIIPTSWDANELGIERGTMFGKKMLGAGLGIKILAKHFQNILERSLKFC